MHPPRPHLIAILLACLALPACKDGGSRIVHRVHTDGVDLIHSRISIDGRLTRFACLASRSGECRYTVLRNGCPASLGNRGETAPAGATAVTALCADRISERFAVRAGHSRGVIDMPPDYRICVSPEDRPVPEPGDCAASAGGDRAAPAPGAR
mgnify:CR=1 FL=1